VEERLEIEGEMKKKVAVQKGGRESKKKKGGGRLMQRQPLVNVTKAQGHLKRTIDHMKRRL